MENRQEKMDSGFPEEMRERVNDLNKRLEALYAKKDPKIIKAIADFSWKLRNGNNKAYSGKNCYEYALYYILEREDPVNLWPPDFFPKKFDFPGENSIEKFIEELEKEY